MAILLWKMLILLVLGGEESTGRVAMKHLIGADFFTAELPLCVREARHGALDSHQHEFFELVYVLDGCGLHRIGANNYPIHAGDVYVISPDEPHAYHPVHGSQLR